MTKRFKKIPSKGSDTSSKQPGGAVKLPGAKKGLSKLPSSNLWRNIRRTAVLIAVIGIGLLIALFVSVDRLVTRRLALPMSAGSSAILSDSVELTSTTPAEGILKALASRDYVKTNDALTSPGLFKIGDGGVEVYRKAFVDTAGTLRPAETERISQTSSVTLEPTMLIPLGTNEQKASERVSLSKIPPIVWQSIISIEDERFYSHFGVDPQAIARAIYSNLSSGRVKQGGSTLTQQLAKNLFFSAERTMSRKVQEAMAALSLERHLSKKEILEMYLNETYFGQQGAIAIHGVATATHAFFGKPLSEITLPEAALLAGVIRAPSNYNPRRYPKRAVQRRNLVLDKLAELGFVGADEAAAAKNAPLKLTKELIRERSAPFFSAAVQQHLQTQINLEAYIPQGVHIYSTIEPVLQRCAEDAITEGLEQLEKKFGRLKRKSPLQASLVSMNPDGSVKAYVGGRDYSLSQYDRASQAQRPIGSTIKPFVYLAALDKSLNGYKVATTQSILEDKPTDILLPTKEIWSPENYEKDYKGDVTLRYAMENSLNIPAVMITQKYGVKTLAKLIENAELADKVEPFPSLALGAITTTLVKLTRAYAGLDAQGQMPGTQFYRTVLDSESAVINTATPSTKQIGAAAATYVLTDVMRGVIERGTGKTVRAAGFNDPAAGKTGTTNDARDAWFMGYTPSLVTGVWVGFDDNKMLGLTGGAAAAPIWANYMLCARTLYPAQQFPVPEGVTFADLDSYSGLLWNDSCQGEKVKEVFVSGTEPKYSCGSAPARTVVRGDQPLPEEEIDTSPRRRGERSIWDSLFGR